MTTHRRWWGVAVLLLAAHAARAVTIDPLSSADATPFYTSTETVMEIVQPSQPALVPFGAADKLSEPSLAWSDGYRWVAANDLALSSNLVRLFQSVTGTGVTFDWAHSVTVAELPGGSAWDQSSDPTVVTDQLGTLYLSVVAFTPSLTHSVCGWDNATLLWRRPLGGEWEAATPANVNGGVLHDRPVLTRDVDYPAHDNHLWLASNTYGEHVANGALVCDEYGYPYVQFSPDGGDSWSAPAPVWASDVVNAVMPASTVLATADLAYVPYMAADAAGATTLRIARCNGRPNGVPVTSLSELPGGRPACAEYARIPAVPTLSDHYHLNNLEATRLNSDPVLAWDNANGSPAVAWMDIGDGWARIKLARRVAGVWTVTVADPEAAVGDDQFLPALASTSRGGLFGCWYQIDRPAIIHFDCYDLQGHSYACSKVPAQFVCRDLDTPGVLAQPVNRTPIVFSNAGGARYGFAGDYTSYDGANLAWTGTLYGYQRNPNAGQPFIELTTYPPPPSCAVVGGRVSDAAPLLLPLVLLLVARKHRDG